MHFRERHFTPCIKSSKNKIYFSFFLSRDYFSILLVYFFKFTSCVETETKHVSFLSYFRPLPFSLLYLFIHLHNSSTLFFYIHFYFPIYCIVILFSTETSMYRNGWKLKHPKGNNSYLRRSIKILYHVSHCFFFSNRIYKLMYAFYIFIKIFSIYSF